MIRLHCPMCKVVNVYGVSNIDFKLNLKCSSCGMYFTNPLNYHDDEENDKRGELV